MQHDDGVGTGRQGSVVAGLLVAAIAAVLPMDDDVQAEPFRDLDRRVRRNVVDQDDPADEVMRDIVVRALERRRRVVGRHDDDDTAAARPRAACGFLGGCLPFHGGKA